MGLTGAPRDQFDLYLLQLLWSNVACCDQDKPCQAATHQDRLILHGFWPEYDNPRMSLGNNGTLTMWPQYCFDNATGFNYSQCYVC